MHLCRTLTASQQISLLSQVHGYVHDNVVKDVDWYGERVLGEISLGGLIILVVIRTIQHNMLKVCKIKEFVNNAMFLKIVSKIQNPIVAQISPKLTRLSGCLSNRTS